jgi:hypothetical protein
MQNDHYVAQTYLRHFAGPTGLLRAYRKSNGATFPCRPRDICHEPDGDIVRDFLSEPGYRRGSVVAMVAVIVGVDFAFFINRFWERLTANVGIVLVFAAFYLRFLRSP